MKICILLVSLILLVSIPIFSDEIKLLATLKSGKDIGAYLEIPSNGLAGITGYPTGYYINEYDGVFALNDFGNKMFKVFSLINGQFLFATTAPQDSFNHVSRAAISGEYFYLANNGRLSVIHKSGRLIQIIEGFMLYNNYETFILRNSVFASDNKYQLYRNIENNQLQKDLPIPWNIQKAQNINKINESSFRLVNENYTLYGDIIGVERTRGMVYKTGFNERGRAFDKEDYFLFTKNGPFRFTNRGHYPTLIAAPSGVLYFILSPVGSIEIWRVIPDNLKGKPFAFGYNEARMEQLGRAGLNAQNPQGEKDFIKSLRSEELMILKNFSFAVQNCSFEDADLQRYFSTYEWYQPVDEKYGTVALLSKAQKALLDEISAEERRR